MLIGIGCGDKGTHYENFSPDAPSNPVPANGAVDQDLTVQLYWRGFDPDGDPLTYQLYFGTASNPPAFAGGLGDTTFTTGQLQPNTLYHWKIIATDPRNASRAGPIWNFTTGAG
jgi:hypothetical protein